ncbi:hypothetical protein K443DRAFT_97841 [Laccaria amethystina LaAM-08-1]|jgi:hypothetical protein|uniref:Palmitoyltransferase n=1 Tax=Laccaria amethystina LaAM-08-1 TaxID=1095629 RepID=A0A0C9XK52_9AGAR|nr:hypothetical protein K443DRAFT_97841 [Laccaria amethystina LaAM-08-1]
MAPRRASPLLSFENLEMDSSISSASLKDSYNDPDVPVKRWYHFIPLFGTVSLILAPHPSLLYVLVDFHLQTLHQPVVFILHLLATYSLTFLAFSSLIVCVARDPGPANLLPSQQCANADTDDEISLTDALMPSGDYTAPGRWCRKCWAPKPERTHHCSICGRCVLKMDHHCPWLGSTCIGHRTYPAFVHFLCSVTLLATYIAVISISALWYAFHNPFIVHEFTPVHELGLAFAGIVFSLVIGSFACYHLYLISTNQTTLENITPFMLLRHLPPLPQTGHSLSDPPLELELGYPQRRLVKDAHEKIRIYDVGFRRNWEQVFGWKTRFGWVHRLWCGGASQGDGRIFPRNPRTDDKLAQLANELVKVDRNS